MKKILLSLFVLSTPLFVKAQHAWARPYFEVGVLGGISSYSGDLSSSIVDFKHMHLAGGIFGRYNMNKYLTFRLQLAAGTVSGDDKDSKQDRNIVRNLHFRSQIVEFGVMGEFNLMGYNPVGHGKMFSPYAFLGISIFNFNPKAKHFDVIRRGDEWVNLQPLNTEGQGLSNFPNRKPYSRTRVSFPLGLGFKFAVHSNLNLGFEIGFRATRTDYLDDVSDAYAYDETVNPDGYLYDRTPYKDGDYLLAELDTDGNIVIANSRSLSFQELMADGTFLLLMRRDESGINYVDKELYERTVETRRQGFYSRSFATRGLDSYLIAGVTISYNFTDEGLSGARQRRKRRAGCKSAQF